jgi:hypothetical protein
MNRQSAAHRVPGHADFYQVIDGSDLLWVVAHERHGAGPIFAYLPPTGLWHHSDGLTDAFYDPVTTDAFTAIDAGTALALIATLNHMRPTIVEWMLNDLMAGPARSGAEFGITHH